MTYFVKEGATGKGSELDKRIEANQNCQQHGREDTLPTSKGRVKNYLSFLIKGRSFPLRVNSLCSLKLSKDISIQERVAEFALGVVGLQQALKVWQSDVTRLHIGSG